MILPIVLLCVLTIVITFILFFLVCYFVPAFKKQTDLHENVYFSKIETSAFEIINSQETYSPVTQKAFVLCSCKKKFKNNSEIKNLSGGTCSIVKNSSSSVTDCRFACIGLGDCIKVCPQHAIFIQNKTAVISELCNGCGKCAEVCPKKIIKLIPVTEKKINACKNEAEILTTCSEFQKSVEIKYPEKKNFKFWYKWYKLLNIKK